MRLYAAPDFLNAQPSLCAVIDAKSAVADLKPKPLTHLGAHVNISDEGSNYTGDINSVVEMLVSLNVASILDNAGSKIIFTLDEMVYSEVIRVHPF